MFVQPGGAVSLVRCWCWELGMHCEEPLCPAGERQLFTSKSIKSGHYLLFFFAVVTVSSKLMLATPGVPCLYGERVTDCLATGQSSRASCLTHQS
eukprot:scaffold156684_cov23-Tisochrysis_lutea.AAC.2